MHPSGATIVACCNVALCIPAGEGFNMCQFTPIPWVCLQGMSLLDIESTRVTGIPVAISLLTFEWVMRCASSEVELCPLLP